MVAAATTPPPPLAGDDTTPPAAVPKRRLPPAGRLTAAERAPLDYLWHAYCSDLGERSLHGAIQDRLMRGSPGGWGEAVIELLELGDGRAELVRVLRVLRREHGATRYEVMRSIGALVTNRRVAIDGGGERLGVWMASSDAHESEHLPTASRGVRLRLLPRDASKVRTREERWRAADEEIERGWREVVAGDDAVVAADPVLVGSSRVRGVLAALARVERRHAWTLRAVYGPRPPAARYDVWGELAPLAEATPTVARLCAARVAGALRGRLAEVEQGVGEAHVGLVQEWLLLKPTLVAEKQERVKVERELLEARRSRLERSKEIAGKPAKRAAVLARLEAYVTSSEDRVRAAEEALQAVEGWQRPTRYEAPDRETALRRALEREATPATVVRESLDTPAGASAAARLIRGWEELDELVDRRSARRVFVDAVERDAEAMLVEACAAYREARS